MLINGINPSIYGAVSCSKVIQSAEVTTYVDWLRQASSPTPEIQKEYWKTLAIQLLVKSPDPATHILNLSNLAKMFKKGTIKFEDSPIYYDCLVDGATSNAILTNKMSVFSVSMKSTYGYKSAVTVNSTGASTVFTGDGNLPSPCILSITSPNDVVTMSISGLTATPITINNLKANKTIIINSENSTVTQDGVSVFLNVDLWEFPKVNPGSVTVGVTAPITIPFTIQYKPRFM